MDYQAEEAVWRRVRGPGPTAEEALLPQRLEALALELMGEEEALKRLSRRLGGSQGAAVSRLASQLRAGTRDLTTLHYLLTGRRLRLKPPAAAPSGSVTEALRLACLRAAQSARAFRGLAEEFQEQAEELKRYAQDSEARQRSLTRILRSRLDRANEK